MKRKKKKKKTEGEERKKEKKKKKKEEEEEEKGERGEGKGGILPFARSIKVHSLIHSFISTH